MKLTLGVEAQNDGEGGATLESVIGVVVGFDADGDLLEADDVRKLPSRLQAMVGFRLIEIGNRILRGQGGVPH